MNEARRLFIGLPPSADVAAAIDTSLDGVEIPGKPAPVENWHFTLRFLGSVDDVGFDRLCAGLDEAELGGPFEISLGGLGAFPKPRRASVLFVGVERGADRMRLLAERIEQAVQEAGFDPEDRPHVPHLTLARIRPPVDVRRLIADVSIPPATMSVGRVTLFESIQSDGGVRYEPLEWFDV